MKNLLALFLLTIISFSNGYSQSTIIDSLEIKPYEIPDDYLTLDKVECKSMQSVLLYENPELYSFVLGDVKEKRFQTFEHKGNKGSIIYMELTKEAENGKGFIESLLWGESAPTEDHPEEVFTKDKVIIILSFPFKSRIGETINKIISDKLEAM